MAKKNHVTQLRFGSAGFAVQTESPDATPDTFGFAGWTRVSGKGIWLRTT